MRRPQNAGKPEGSPSGFLYFSGVRDSYPACPAVEVVSAVTVTD